jgi:Kef-type K+ transport system membrane component KefB
VTPSRPPVRAHLGHGVVYLVIIGSAVLALVLLLPIGAGLSPAPDAGDLAAAPSPTAVAASAAGLQGSALVSRLFLAVAVIILVARLVGSLFARIHQPRVVGEIVAGIVLGPSLLGLFVPSAAAFLFAPEVTSVLKTMAQFGLVFFMFLVGLRLDLGEVGRSGRTAVFVSHVSIVVPFILGVAGALVIYPRVGHGNFTAFALFLGAAMAITAFPVLARILTDTGLDGTRLGALAITCAAVDDLTAWCILSVVVAIARSAGPADVVRTVGLTTVFLAAMILVVRPIIARLLEGRLRRGHLDPSMLAVLLACLFLSAWTAEEIGIHAVFGAFLMGAILPRTGGLAPAVIGKLDDATTLFLLPLFFAVVGLATRITVLERGALWTVLILVLAIAITGKLVGSSLAGLACGLDRRDALGLGVLMNARGVTEIVILTIGLEIGVITPALFTIMVLMALVTTFMATPLLALILPDEVQWREPVGPVLPDRPVVARH